MPRSLVLFALATLVGCGVAAKAPVLEEFSDLEPLDPKSDAFSYRMKIVGSLAYGETSAPLNYTATPRFSAFKFAGQPGDEVSIWVRSANGDAVAWLLDNRFRVVAHNDDADRTTFDAHLTAKLPGNTNPEISTYYIVLREYALDRARFTVALEGPQDKVFDDCTVDADCVAVPRGGCCDPNAPVAVNLRKQADYKAQATCKPPYPPCAQPPPFDPNRSPLCNGETKRCEMVPFGDIICGIRSANPHQCPRAWTCTPTPDDRPGMCVPAGCDYAGKHYEVGVGFPSSDGCNTCSCSDNGQVVCTKRACPAPACDPAREPKRRYVGRSSDECARIRFACAPGQKMFANACGCGCETP